MWIGTRGPWKNVVWGSYPGQGKISGKVRDDVLAWKKKNINGGDRSIPMPDVTGWAQFLIERGAMHMDLWTVPPPSFHSMNEYPALMLAQEVGKIAGKEISILWPEKYEKKGKVWHANISKVYPAPVIDVNDKVILVLDDIATTCNTLAAACLAIVKAGGIPAGCAYA